MPKFIIRIVVSLVVPCLVIDPALANVLTGVPQASLHPKSSLSTFLTTEAIIAPDAGAQYSRYAYGPKVRIAVLGLLGVTAVLETVITRVPTPLALAYATSWAITLGYMWMLLMPPLETAMAMTGFRVVADHQKYTDGFRPNGLMMMETDNPGSTSDRDKTEQQIDTVIRTFVEVHEPRMVVRHETPSGEIESEETWHVEHLLQMLRQAYVDPREFMRDFSWINHLIAEWILSAAADTRNAVTTDLNLWLYRFESGQAPGDASRFTLPISYTLAAQGPFDRTLSLERIVPTTQPLRAMWPAVDPNAKQYPKEWDRINNLETPGEGFMLISRDRQGNPRLEGWVSYQDVDGAGIYLWVLEIAPWNRGPARVLRGVGSVLQARVIEASLEEGYGGGYFSNPDSMDGLSLDEKSGVLVGPAALILQKKGDQIIEGHQPLTIVTPARAQMILKKQVQQTAGMPILDETRRPASTRRRSRDHVGVPSRPFNVSDLSNVRHNLERIGLEIDDDWLIEWIQMARQGYSAFTETVLEDIQPSLGEQTPEVLKQITRIFELLGLLTGYNPKLHYRKESGKMSLWPGSERYERWVAPLWESPLFTWVFYELVKLMLSITDIGPLVSITGITWVTWVALGYLFIGGLVMVPLFKLLHHGVFYLAARLSSMRQRGPPQVYWSDLIVAHLKAFVMASFVSIAMAALVWMTSSPVTLLAFAILFGWTYGIIHTVLHYDHNLHHPAGRRWSLLPVDPEKTQQKISRFDQTGRLLLVFDRRTQKETPLVFTRADSLTGIPLGLLIRSMEAWGPAQFPVPFNRLNSALKEQEAAGEESSHRPPQTDVLSRYFLAIDLAGSLQGYFYAGLSDDSPGALELHNNNISHARYKGLGPELFAAVLEQKLARSHLDWFRADVNPAAEAMLVKYLGPLTSREDGMVNLTREQLSRFVVRQREYTRAMVKQHGLDQSLTALSETPIHRPQQGGLVSKEQVGEDRWLRAVTLTDGEVIHYFGEKAQQHAQSEGRRFMVRRLDPKADLHFLEEWQLAIRHDTKWQAEWQQKHGHMADRLPRFSYIDEQAFGLLSEAHGQERLEGFVGFNFVTTDYDYQKKAFTFRAGVMEMELYFRNIGSAAEIPGVADLLMEYFIKAIHEWDVVSHGFELIPITPGSNALVSRWAMKRQEGNHWGLTAERIASEYSNRTLANRLNNPSATSVSHPSKGSTFWWMLPIFGALGGFLTLGIVRLAALYPITIGQAATQLHNPVWLDRWVPWAFGAMSISAYVFGVQNLRLPFKTVLQAA